MADTAIAGVQAAGEGTGVPGRLPRLSRAAELGVAAVLVLLIAGALWLWSALAQRPAPPPPADAVDPQRTARLAAPGPGFSDVALARLQAQLDPAAFALASRLDPVARPRLQGRTPGWSDLDVSIIPALPWRAADFAAARELNELVPLSPGALRPMTPFVLRAGADDRRRAETCLAQAVYYEAAREPLEGQQAVAQTVLNRLRHPAYPKSVCGVVFQGSQRATGCQFSFTCDGALAYAPEPGLWARAREVARKALDGFVLRTVGSATHYHADYVYPYWAPTLNKLNKIGAHIFYRWTGPSGLPAAFTGRYAGAEARIPDWVLRGGDERTQGLILGALASDDPAAGAPQAVITSRGVVAEAGRLGQAPVLVAPGDDGRVIGILRGGRRPATAEDVARINEQLKTFEGRDAAAAPLPTAQPLPTPPPAGPAAAAAVAPPARNPAVASPGAPQPKAPAPAP